MAPLASLQFAPKQSKNQTQKQNGSSSMDVFMLIFEFGSGLHCEGKLLIFSTSLALIHILGQGLECKPSLFGGGWMDSDQNMNI